MDRTKQTITVCTSCRHKGTNCKPGLELITLLRAALDTAGHTLDPDFEISGLACMAGCDRRCDVAYHATGKATYLFGDIAPDTDIADLVAYADQYRAQNDRRDPAPARRDNLSTLALEQVPSAMIVSTTETLQ